MKRLVNRLSWLLLGFSALTGAGTLLVVAGAAFFFHRSLSFPTVWLLVAAATLYLLIRDREQPPAEPPAPPPPAPPEREVPLEELELLHRMWQRGDISEATYRRAVSQATRRYAPPPPPPPVRHRRWWQ